MIQHTKTLFEVDINKYKDGEIKKLLTQNYQYVKITFSNNQRGDN